MTKIRNIGKVSRQWLYEIGIYTLDDLQKSGAMPVFQLIRANHPRVSLNLLWALEGAILDIDWREIPESRKQELRQQLH